VRYGIVAEYGGQGIGTSMHIDPFLAKASQGAPAYGPRLMPAMPLAVGPILRARREITTLFEIRWVMMW